MGLTFRLGQVPLAIFTDTSNNVGIGAAASGSFKLQVTGTTNLTGALSGTSATFRVNADRNLAIKYDTHITLSGQSDSGAPESLRIYADTFRIFTATTAGGLTERLTIANTGAATFSSSVNLGSIANSGDISLLNIKQSSTAYNNGLYIERGGERNGYFMYIGGGVDSLTFRRNYFGTQSDVMSLTRDGNVGIGTPTPNSILEVQRDTNGDTPINFINGSGGSGNTNASISLNFTLRNGSGGSSGGVILKVGKETDHIGTNVNDFFAISTTRNDSMGERFRISSGGNVYIGSTGGDGRFYVKTASANAYNASGYNGTNANIRLESGATVTTGTTTGISYGIGGSAEAYIGAVQNSSGLAEIVFQNYDGAYRERMRIVSSGNINLNDTVYNNTAVATTRTLYIGSDYRIGGISSIRESKKNIENVSNIDWIYDLNPVTFNYRKKDEEEKYTDDVYDELVYGLIAEDTAPIADFLVNYNNKEDGTKEMVGIEYMRLITPMLKAIQELKAEIEQLKQK